MINRVGAFLLPPSPEQAVAEDFGILAVIPVLGAFQMLVTDRLPLGSLHSLDDASDSRVRRHAR
jgi:hypothetical protein